MIDIDTAIKICNKNYRRFYQIEVDCKQYIGSNDIDNRTILFRQPTYIDYIRSGTAPDIRFFSKRILCEKIFMFIKHSNFIKSIEDLYIVDTRCPDLFEKIIIMTNIIAEGFTETELKIINTILNEMIKGADITNVEFETEEEFGVYKWAIPFIYTFWTTQNENGLIRINTNEVFDLLLHENNLLNIVQMKAIEYKKSIYERELAKVRRK